VEHPVLELPHPRAIARHALPHIIEGTLIPLGIFYVTMWAAGVWGAALSALVWGYGTVLRRLYRRERVPGILVIGAALVTARTIVALQTGSVFLYFLQPTLGTVLVAGLFLLSVPIGKPLAERLARDFCPLPESLLARPFMRTFFIRISLLWAAVFLTNAAVSFYLLLNQSVGTYVITKQALSSGLWVAAIATSTWYFVRLMRRHGIKPSFTGTVVG
jgi:intracellular septation protein A